ncbi:MAG TPA: ABC transporter ATP-binding protein [Gaiellales bacterium]|nr:ABC transporter ATP-binding protein [Gaiellales bacterium]
MAWLDRQGAALSVRELTKVYAGGVRALSGFSLRVPSGTFYGLLGPNGSGKSTLIGMVCGLVRAPAGRVFVFGHDAVADAPRARLLVGVAPQEVHLDRFLTVRDVLVFHGRYFGMAKLEASRRADALLDVFDLTAKRSVTPNRLSGGMRRRLLLARALVHSPRLVILDEPTAGVDLEQRYELWRYLRRLHGSERATVLFTTHYLEEAERLCERISFVRSGAITAEGTPEELVSRYSALDLEGAYLEAMR